MGSWGWSLRGVWGGVWGGCLGGEFEYCLLCTAGEFGGSLGGSLGVVGGVG